MRWFRFYDEALDDPKVQRLSPELFKAWVNLLCIASRNGGTIPTNFEDLAFSLRMSASKLTAQVEALKQAGLLDQGETLHPHNWNGRQYESDSSAPRVKRFRERKRNASCNVTPTVTETPPEAETDTEAETEQKQRQTPPTILGCHERYSEVCQAILDRLGGKAVNAINLNRVDAMLKAGADPDLDIYPTIDRLSPRWESGSIKFFERAIMDSLATRTAPLPAGQAKSQFFNPIEAAKRATA